MPSIWTSGGKVFAECVDCREEFTLDVTPEQVDRWRNGELIQRAMPNLSDDQRELFLSGMCGECWDAMFSELEEESEIEEGGSA